MPTHQEKGYTKSGNELQTTTEQSAELQAARATSAERAEIESAIIIAKKFPRNTKDAWQRLIASCQRPAFAESAAYSFPRGDKDVTGPAVYLAREAARAWGNIRFGLRILRDDESSRLIQGWCWDLETNMKNEFEDQFEKLIFRKGKGWIEPDERDLRELTNRRGAILVRNAILQTVPDDFIEDALQMARKTLEAGAQKDPDATRKRLMADFATIGVTVSMIEGYLGSSLEQATAKQLADLRAMHNSITAGNSKWADYTEKEAPAESKSDVNEQLAKQTPPKQTPPKQEQAPTSQPSGATAGTAQSPPSAPSGSGGPVSKFADPQCWADYLAYFDSDPDLARLRNRAKAAINMLPSAPVSGIDVPKREILDKTIRELAKKEGRKLDV